MTLTDEAKRTRGQCLVFTGTWESDQMSCFHILSLTAENPSRIELSNKDRKNRPMQQEDEYRIQMELNRYLRKEISPAATQSDRSFYETEAARTPSSRGEQLMTNSKMSISTNFQ